MKEYVDDGLVYKEGGLIRELTVEEWKRRAWMHGFVDFEMCVEDSKTGIDIYYTASKIEKPLVEKLMDDTYWKSVDNCHFDLYFSLQSKLSVFGDEFVIEREIALCKYTLHPDLLPKNELPMFVTTMTPSEKEKIQLISKAYSEMLDHGRWVAKRKRRWDMNYYALADGYFKYMKWLNGLLEYCRKWNRYGFSEVVNYNREIDLFQGLLGTPSFEDVAPVSVVTEGREGFVGLRQAALLLRYSGITVHSMSYDSKASKLAEEMCGLTSVSSGSQLFDMWYETANKYGREHLRKLFEGYIAGTTKQRTVTNHFRDLKAVRDYLGSGEVYERVNSDCLYLEDKLESQK
jgi:hypothetical protein